MFLYNKTTEIKPGKGWKDVNGVRHPKNWNIWSDDHKKAMNIEEITLDNGIDGISNITDKPLDSVTKDGRTVKGIRSEYIQKVKEQQSSLLAQTDWAIIRKADADVAVPTKIATWRAAIRTKATAMEKAITDASDMSAFKALFLVWDKDNNKSGILFDWPELEE